MLMEQAINKLITKKWFSASELEIQENLKNCKDDGFLNIIINIDDENDFGTVVRMTNYWHNSKITCVSLEIRNSLTNQVVQSDFICWNQGNNPLCRGIILIEENSKISKIVLESKYNLTTFSKEQKSFSMSFPDYSNNKVIKLPERIAQAIGNHTIVKYIDLGEIYPEDSLIYSKTILFALIININDINRIDHTKISIIDIGDNESINNTKDGYLQSVISRLKYDKII